MEKNTKVLLIVGALLAFVLVACGAMLVGGVAAYGVYRWFDVQHDTSAVIGPEEWAEPPIPRATPAPEYRGEMFGALLVEVAPGSAAERAGLQPGDLIVAVDRRAMDEGSNLADLIGGYQPGDRVTLEVWRPGEYPSDVQVTLDENPDRAGAARLGVTYRPWQGPADWPWPGAMQEFEPEEWLDPQRTPMPGWRGTRGLVVVELVEGGPAEQAGVQVGDILTRLDGQEVETRQDVIDLLAQYEPGDKVVLTLYRHRNRQSREVTVTLGEHPNTPGMAYLGVSLGEGLLEFEQPGPRGIQEPQSLRPRAVPVLPG